MRTRVGEPRRSSPRRSLALGAARVRARRSRGRRRASSTGFLHPISGLDHVLAMVAVGLWGAQLGAPAIWLLPGHVSDGDGVRRIARPDRRSAARRRVRHRRVGDPARRRGDVGAPPAAHAAAALVGFFAIFHGHAHGTELPPGQSGAALQHGLRDRDRAACTRSASRSARSIAGRGDGSRCASPAAASDWRGSSSCGGRSHEAASPRARPAGRLRRSRCAPRAGARASDRDRLGPVYDGITHFALTPEDLIPVLALALLAGLARQGSCAARDRSCCPARGCSAASSAQRRASPLLATRCSWLPLLVLGGLVAADARLPAAAMTAIAALLGLVPGSCERRTRWRRPARASAASSASSARSSSSRRSARRASRRGSRDGCASPGASPEAGSRRAGCCCSAGRCGSGRCCAALTPRPASGSTTKVEFPAPHLRRILKTCPNRDPEDRVCCSWTTTTRCAGRLRADPPAGGI